MKIVTFNIRCSWDKDGINSFPHRAGGILQKITEERPDVIFFQESTDKNIQFLKNALPEYHIIFSQRKSDLRGEGLATALRKQTTELIGLAAFWLSPTPNVPGSRYAGQSNSPRICQIVTLRCEDKVFRGYNVHLDHVSADARLSGIKLVLDRIQKDLEWIPFPFFLCGDFNATPQDVTIRYCNEFQPVKLVELTEKIDHTFHNYGKKTEPCKIDYIFTDVKTASLPNSVTPWTDESDGIYLSDHYPICIEL